MFPQVNGLGEFFYLIKHDNNLLTNDKNLLKSKYNTIISEVLFMKRETLFLKIAVVLTGLPVLVLCIFLLPETAEFFAELNPKLDFLQYPFLIGLYVTAIVFFVALYQTLKLLSYIDRNQAFSDLSVKTLIGMVIIFGCMVIAVFAAVLQKLLKNAIDIKSENDLTI